MAHRVISLKYRPQKFDELTGQKHIVLSLKGAINSGRIGQAFLFAGPRGVGKTTTARIFAKSLNCEQGPTVEPCQKCQSCREITLSRSIDVVEIDGASNRGIDEIRDLREAVRYSPIQGKYKIYIIDEVHMLTQEAFNALLKTLEEPPSKVIFIFATTAPMKVPVTILSRCQRFVFKRLSWKEIISRLKFIAQKEDIKISDKALHHVAVRADGSIRDAESVLEQLSSFVEGEIQEKDVFDLIGFLDSSFYLQILKHIKEANLKEAITILNRGIENGADPVEIYRGFTNYTRAALLSKVALPEEFIELDSDELELLKTINLNKSELINIIEECLHFEPVIKRSINGRFAIELLFSKLILILSQPARGHKQNEKEKDKNIAPEESNKPGQTFDLKSELFSRLQKLSPKLAGIIHKAEIEKIDDTINIRVGSDFSRQQLLNNAKKINAVIKQLTGKVLKLNIEILKQKKSEDGLIKSIKSLFDGEEVR